MCVKYYIGAVYSSSIKFPRYGGEVYGWGSRLFIRRGSTTFPVWLQDSQSSMNCYKVHRMPSGVIVMFTWEAQQKQYMDLQRLFLSVCRGNRNCSSSEFFQKFLWDSPVITGSAFSRITSQPSTISKYEQRRQTWLALLIKIYNSRKIIAKKNDLSLMTQVIIIALNWLWF